MQGKIWLDSVEDERICSIGLWNIKPNSLSLRKSLSTFVEASLIESETWFNAKLKENIRDFLGSNLEWKLWNQY